ncbi:MAG: hybrid sensor histidine kinase/response regulator [Anaerolineae bacterium]|nr:hybrid sensor histidine kinase/response regulator [Anaerolineae bacterium]
MLKQEFGRSDDLAYLRAESLRPVLYGLMVVLYLWYMVVFQPVNQVKAAGWGPVVLLGGGLAVAFITRKRNISFASAALILGMITAILYTMWLTNAVALPYLLAVAVSLTGLLFSLRVVVGMTALCGAAVMAIGSLHWGHSLFSGEVLSPVLVIVLQGSLSSLTVRNLYLTLYWAWDRAMAVQRNEEMLLDRQGELARALKALDVAYKQLEHLNYDLARAREAAEEAKWAKQQFATNISHELRTPLNVILAFSEMMYLSPGSYSVPLPPAYRGDIREIYRSSKHLLKLTEDVLSLSKIEAREMKIHPEPVRLPEIVTEVLGMIRPLLRGKDVELRAELPGELPPVVIDRVRIGQVLLNLLNNARRFTENGNITVSADLEAEHVKVTVADTGAGIPPDKLNQVFKEFRQLENLGSLQQDGTGLGLAISKRFVEMHGGRIWAESEGLPGRGSRFYFTLPRREFQPVEAGPREPLPLVRTPSGRGWTILLLDQDPYVARMLEEGLEDFQVVVVKNVAEVPGLIQEKHVRAIVLNQAQPSLAWPQMLELRAQPGDISTPLILCPLVGPRHLGQALGIKNYLVKPVTREALGELINRLDRPIGRILVIDDDPRMANLLMRLLADMGEHELSWAANGQEGLQKLQAAPLPDLVLMDLGMPEMDGYNLLARIREDPCLDHLPVAVITAHTGSPEEERRLGGKSFFITQPAGFSNDEVLHYLRYTLEAVAVCGPSRRITQVVEGGEQVGLKHGLLQIGSSA